MKITLKNFRCYADKEFDLEKGVVLISGQSGAGKTTILMAIDFVLYGNGTKLISFGKTSCKVEMIYEELKIIRTKRPNRLVLNISGEEFEDDSAQEIINKKFGNTFDVISYLRQNALKSFIMMSPLEKLGFLERFAFKDIDLQKIKGHCKGTITKRNEEMIAVISQYNMANEHFSEMKKPIKIQCPFEEEVTLESLMEEYENMKESIENLTQKIDSLKEEIYAAKTIEKEIEMQQKNIEKLENKQNSLLTQRQILEEKIFDFEDLHHIKQSIICSELQQEIKGCKDDLEANIEIYEREFSRQEKYKQEKENLWSKISKKDTENSIQQLKEEIRLAESMKKLKEDYEKIFNKKFSEKKGKINEEIEVYKNNVQKYTKLLESLQEKKINDKITKKILTCPNCEISLNYSEGKLHIIEDVCEKDHKKEDEEEEEDEKDEKDEEFFEDEISINKQKISILRRIEENIENINNDPTKLMDSLEDLIEYRKSQEMIEEKLESFSENFLENLLEKISEKESLLQNLQKKYNGLLKELRNTPKSANAKIIVEYRKTKNLSALKDMLMAHQNAEKEIEEIDETFSELEKEIQELRRDMEKETQDTKKLEKKLETLTAKKSRHKKDLEVQEKLIEESRKYFEYQKEQEKYKSWQKKVQTLKKDEEEKRTLYAAALKMKEKITEAESIAIINIIESINVHAQEFLDLFFPHDPIIVRLLPFKETKKSTKPQINLQIDYKGMDADITMLSGGELSRVILAYNLALCEIFNSPIILLDECTASLDQDLTNTVIEGIRKNFENKMVIIIAHQVVSGIFDRIIQI